MQKKIKIKDISRRLNLSVTTVSLVLNNKGDRYGIKRDTQEKVLLMAKRMGYFDQETEMSPIEKTPGVIGVIVPSLENLPNMGLFARFNGAFSSMRLATTIIAMDADRDRYMRMLSSYIKFYSGLIFIGDAIDDIIAKKMLDAEYPFVVIGKDVKSLRVNTVKVDQHHGAEQLSQYVAALGYKNILLLSSCETNNRVLTDSLRQIPDMRYESLVVERNVIGGQYDFAPMMRYLRPPFRAEIVIANQASLVYPLFDYLKSVDIRIPSDLALFSMEEEQGFDSAMCSIAFMSTPYDEMASKASAILWQEIRNSGKSKVVQHLSLTPSIVMGKSSGLL